MDNWGKYLRAKEPGVREKAYAWKTAIGLQKVDGLTPSDYLIKTAQRNIEGKTRTTSIFTIKYMRRLGFDVQNDVFAENAWYFRNALVRANYTNIPRGVHPTLVYLERFFSNLLLGTSHKLMNRQLHISLAAPESELAPSEGEQVREQVGGQAKADAIRQFAEKPSKFVQKLLCVMKGEMTVLEMMVALKLGGRRNFLERYLTPAIESGLVEMTQPDSPRSPTQRYRLTAKGRKAQSGDEELKPKNGS